MKTKGDIRKMLEIGMMEFLAAGKKITKVEAKQPRTKQEPEEEVVEIEVEMLPLALQQKFFSE